MMSPPRHSTFAAGRCRAMSGGIAMPGRRHDGRVQVAPDKKPMPLLEKAQIRSLPFLVCWTSNTIN